VALRVPQSVCTCQGTFSILTASQQSLFHENLDVCVTYVVQYYHEMSVSRTSYCSNTRHVCHVRGEVLTRDLCVTYAVQC
jgi:hypothetical protein